MDTFTVNGRFSADAAGLNHLAATFGVDVLNNAGIRITPAFLLESATIPSGADSRAQVVEPTTEMRKGRLETDRGLSSCR